MAPGESFFATLKRELAWIHQRTTWPTRAQLQTALFDYVEAFYNPERIQQRRQVSPLAGYGCSIHTQFA